MVCNSLLVCLGYRLDNSPVKIAVILNYLDNYAGLYDSTKHNHIPRHNCEQVLKPRSHPS